MRYLTCCFVSAVLACAAATHARADDTPSTAKLGKKIAIASLKDVAGKTVSLGGVKDQKATVIVFLSFECPVSNSYAQPLADMAKEFGKHGITFIGVTVNPDDSDADVAKYAKDYNIP